MQTVTRSIIHTTGIGDTRARIDIFLTPRER
jgi:hypothetical protein